RAADVFHGLQPLPDRVRLGLRLDRRADLRPRRLGPDQARVQQVRHAGARAVLGGAVQTVNLIADARYTDDKPNVLHAVKTDQLLVDGVYLKPAQKTGWHKHPDADRAYICVQGNGELVLETVAAGNELRIPLGPA